MDRSTAAARVSAQTAYGLARSVSWPGFAIREYTLRPGETLEAHHHERPVIVSVIDGCYEQVFAGERLECPAGTTVVVPGGERHAERVGTTGSTCLLITPSVEIATEMSAGPGTLDDFHRLEVPTLARLGRRLREALDDEDDLAPLQRRSLTLDLALTLARSGRAARSPSVPPWVGRAKERLDDGFRDVPSLGEIARELDVSAGHLARSFRLAYGCSVGEYVRERRLDEGERLLRATTEPLTRVAFLSGFCDQSHFGRAFRSRYGYSPARYRSLHEV